MRRFLYWRDPVFVSAVLLYFLNRWMLKPLMLGHVGFFQDYFNDLLCIPFFLPIVLFAHRLIRLRKQDGPPTVFEVLANLVVWSVFFEVVGPRVHSLYPHTVADPWDVLAYAAGAAIAFLIWRRPVKMARAELVAERQVAHGR